MRIRWFDVLEHGQQVVFEKGECPDFIAPIVGVAIVEEIRGAGTAKILPVNEGTTNAIERFWNGHVRVAWSEVTRVFRERGPPAQNVFNVSPIAAPDAASDPPPWPARSAPASLGS